MFDIISLAATICFYCVGFWLFWWEHCTKRIDRYKKKNQHRCVSSYLYNLNQLGQPNGNNKEAELAAGRKSVALYELAADEGKLPFENRPYFSRVCWKGLEEKQSAYEWFSTPVLITTSKCLTNKLHKWPTLVGASLDWLQSWYVWP